MSVVITHDVWLESIPPDHRNKFDYSKANYTAAKNKVIIICKNCSAEFLQRADSHRGGTGCRKCSDAVFKSSYQLTHEEFLQRSKAAEGEHYGYEFAQYKNSTTKVQIVCPVGDHGLFDILPPLRMRGQHCPKCAHEVRIKSQRRTQEEFIKKCESMGREKYSYEHVEYVNDGHKVVINCKEHGPFRVKPSNFLQGSGCRSCAKTGYRTNTQGWLYVLSDGNITKVGITNRTPATRAKEVERRGGPRMEVVAGYFYRDGTIPLRLEGACKRYLAAKYKPVEAKFDGSKECFLDVNVTKLLDFIQPLATNPESEQSDQQT